MVPTYPAAVVLCSIGEADVILRITQRFVAPAARISIAPGRRPNAMKLHRDLNQRKQTDELWMYEVSKCAPQEALRDLDTSYIHFFRRVERKK